MSEKHIPAITKYRDTSGYREGWDRHAEEWVIIAPPPLDCTPEVTARYREQLAREKALWDSPPRVSGPHSPPAPNLAAAYARGYAAGRKKGRAEAIEEQTQGVRRARRGRGGRDANND